MTTLPTATRVRKGSKFVIRVSCPDGTSFDIGGARSARANAVIVCQQFTLDQVNEALSAKPYTVTLKGGRRTLGTSWTVDVAAEAARYLANMNNTDPRYAAWIASHQPGHWGQLGVRADVSAAQSEANKMNERVPLVHYSVVLVEEAA